MPMTTTSYIPTSTTRSVAVAELPPRISDGDPLGWEEILRQCGKFITATVRSFRLLPADALDVAQVTWLQLDENPRSAVPRPVSPMRKGAAITFTGHHRSVTRLPGARSAGRGWRMKRRGRRGSTQ
jgi:hypothetical protein